MDLVSLGNEASPQLHKHTARLPTFLSVTSRVGSSSAYNDPIDQQACAATIHQQKDNGTLTENPPEQFKLVTSFGGGGGLYSRAPDYLKFTRMLLGGGKLGETKVLEARTVNEA